MTTLAKRYVSALVKTQNISSLIASGNIDHLFLSHELPLYKYVTDFAKKYGKFPSAETVKLETGDILPPADETPAYYQDLLVTKWTENCIKKAGTEAAALLQPATKDVDGAMAKMAEMVMEVMQKKNVQQLRDFRDAYDTLWPAYKAKLDGSNDGAIQFGWPTLDEMLGGIGPGDLISIVGRPAQGKTWFLLWAMMHAYMKQKKPVMFVSMEMGLLPIQQRIASMMLKLPVKKVMNSALDAKDLKKYKNGLIEVKGYEQPLWLVDGNLAATVDDIWALARSLGPEAIYLDGGYLVKHPTVRDRYQRVAENADLMKMQLASIAPTVVSWQFAKTGAKKNQKKGEKAGLEDIGYTDAIAQVSSLVMGLSQPDSVETVAQRLVDILKGRNGEVGQFLTNWNFEAPHAMDFSEFQELATEELQFN